MKDHISVCVCTYHRNLMLENLLKTLSQQDTFGLFDYSVIVVDNDATGPAEEIVKRMKDKLHLELVYGIEPEQTIPAARNHALRLANGNYIGIIDDDEFAPHNWLINMYRAVQTFNVDGALGPVLPFYEGHPPLWLVKSGLCERPILRTGTLLDWNDTRTGNVLLKKDVFTMHNLFFDVKCKTSGSDKEFFKKAIEVGCRFIAVEEAPVYEIVPTERQTKKYYIRRYRIQASNERKFRAPMLHGLSKVLIPMKVIARLLIYTLLLPLCVLAGSHMVMKYGLKIIYHFSWLLTMLGFDLAKKRNF